MIYYIQYYRFSDDSQNYRPNRMYRYMAYVKIVKNDPLKWQCTTTTLIYLKNVWTFWKYYSKTTFVNMTTTTSASPRVPSSCAFRHDRMLPQWSNISDQTIDEGWKLYEFALRYYDYMMLSYCSDHGSYKWFWNYWAMANILLKKIYALQLFSMLLRQILHILYT